MKYNSYWWHPKWLKEHAAFVNSQDAKLYTPFLPSVLTETTTDMSFTVYNTTESQVEIKLQTVN